MLHVTTPKQISVDEVLFEIINCILIYSFSLIYMVYMLNYGNKWNIV